jgi:hypothetical protein
MSSAGCVARSGTTEHLISIEYNPEKIPKWYGVRTTLMQNSPTSNPLIQDVEHGEFLNGHRDFFFNGKKHVLTQAVCAETFGSVYHYYGFYPALVEQTPAGARLPQKPFKNIYHSRKPTEPHVRIEDWDSFDNSGSKNYVNAALPSDGSVQYTSLSVTTNVSSAGIFQLSTGEVGASNNPYRTTHKMRLYTGCTNSNIIYIAGPTIGVGSNFIFSEPIGEVQLGPSVDGQIYWGNGSTESGSTTAQNQSGGADRVLITEVEDTGSTVTLTGQYYGGTPPTTTTSILKVTLDQNITLGPNIVNAQYVASLGSATAGDEAAFWLLVDTATDVADNKGDTNTSSFRHPGGIAIKKIIWEQY